MDAANQVLVFLFLLLSYCIFRKKYGNKADRRRRPQVPEPEGAWPIIGHLHVLGDGDQLLYRTLGAMADKYGPIFNIRLGTSRALVISGREAAKECFTVNDQAFASRPVLTATRLMCYDSSMFGLAPYGNYWRQMRKIVSHELLAKSQLEKLRLVWEPEITESMHDLYNQCTDDTARPVPVNLSRWFEQLALNVVVRLVAGKRYCGVSADQCDDDGWLDLQGHEKAMKEAFKQLDLILEGWLQEHRHRRDSFHAGSKGNHDFIDIMLSIQEKGQFSGFPYDADTCIKSTCLSTVLGGGGTMPGALTWAIALLMNNRHALKKAQEELDAVVGPNRCVLESDIGNLPYIRAIINETMRLYPPGPLLAPRESIEDCTVGGYFVPAGTRLVVNVWKIQRDPNVWTDPAEFKPERFIMDKANVDALGSSFELIPFGFGRRACSGATFALQVLHLTLARLLHAFDVATIGDQPVDMTESPGLSLPKAKPLEVLLTPRSASSLYA